MRLPEGLSRQARPCSTFGLLGVRPASPHCPPIAEAYAGLHTSGLEVVSVDLDTIDAKARAETVAKAQGIVWPQAFDGLGFEGPVATGLGLEVIPKMLLIDGDTGRIVATEEELTKTGIRAAIEAALRRKLAKAP